MELSIIILNYNTEQLTINCINSIIEQYKEELEKNKFEIILVDNASTDTSAAGISSLKFPRLAAKRAISNLKLILNKKNMGFAGGCNIGAGRSRGKYILFLNSDTRVKDSGFLKMVRFLDENERVGVLGGKLLNPDGSAQASVGKFYNLFNLFLMLFWGERFGMLRQSPKKVVQVNWVSGACMMIRRNVFEKLKGFDEHFFMYIEDMELCYNALKLGFLTYFYPNASATHNELGSGNRAFAITNIYKGILYFYKKHKSRLEYYLAKLLLTIKAAIAILIGVLSGNNYLKSTYGQAIKF